MQYDYYEISKRFECTISLKIMPWKVRHALWPDFFKFNAGHDLLFDHQGLTGMNFSADNLVKKSSLYTLHTCTGEKLYVSQYSRCNLQLFCE